MATGRRALEKAKALIQTDPYEAQQVFKSVYHRQRAKKNVDESLETLREGAILQLHNGHLTCGVELGVLLVEDLIANNIPAVSKTIQPVIDIIKAFPLTEMCADRANQAPATVADSTKNTTAPSTSTAAPLADDVAECSRLVSVALTWANKEPRLSLEAAQQIHAAFSEYLWKRYRLSQLKLLAPHLLRSGEPELHAQVLRAVASADDLDIFLTQAVLQVLAVARPHSKAASLNHAKALLAACKTQPDGVAAAAAATVTKATSPASQPPLINFLSLLIEALERRSQPLMALLRDRYATALSIDPAWSKYLDTTESTYLGVKRSGGSDDAMQRLFKQFLGGSGSAADGGTGGRGGSGLVIEEEEEEGESADDDAV